MQCNVQFLPLPVPDSNLGDRKNVRISMDFARGTFMCLEKVLAAYSSDLPTAHNCPPSTVIKNSSPFSLSIQPLTVFAILSYGKRDFAEAEGRKTEIEERCTRRRRGGGRGKKFHTGPEGRNLAKETENQRRIPALRAG